MLLIVEINRNLDDVAAGRVEDALTALKATKRRRQK